MKEITEREDLEQVNGGGIVGAVAGYVIGCFVGGVLGSAAMAISRMCGDTENTVSTVFGTVFTASVVLFTGMGVCLPA